MGCTVEALANDTFHAPLYQSEPQQRLAASYCRKCQEVVLEIGVFCTDCFAVVMEQEREYDFGTTWYGREWAISLREWEQRKAGAGKPEQIEAEWQDVVAMIAGHVEDAGVSYAAD
jgi:hypothetical protein